jgi:hypothetical protein
VNGSDNPADILTKNLGKTLFDKFLLPLGLVKSHST